MSIEEITLDRKKNNRTQTRFELRYRTLDGKERSKRFLTKKAAEEYEQEQMVQMRKGGWTDPLAGRVTLATWSAEWQQTIVHLAESTTRIHADNMRLHALPDVRDRAGKVTAAGLGAFELGKLTTAQLTKWVAAMSRKPRSKGAAERTLAPASVHQAYRTLHLCLEAAVACGHIGRNPLDGVRPPRVDQVPMRFLSAAEVQRVAAAMDDRYRAVVMIGCMCGLRAGELMALRWENVDMLGRKIQVVEQFDKERGPGAVKAPKTAAGRRAVSMPRAVVDALAEHGARSRVEQGIEVGALTGLVFTGSTGLMMDIDQFRRTEWSRAVRAADVAPLRIHDMRHTAASLAIQSGADVKVIQRMLGHASAAMTLDRYGHLMPGQAEAVADRMDALMSAVLAV